MTRYLLIGLTGDTSLKLVDLEKGTVETIAADAVDESVAHVREAGATIMRGVDVAIGIEDRTDAVGRFFFAQGK